MSNTAFEAIRTARLRVGGAACVLGLVVTGVIAACATPQDGPKSRTATAAASVSASASAVASSHATLDAGVPQTPPSSAIVVVNIAAAADERFNWIYGNAAWDVAHMITRLNIGKETDWLAFVHVPEDAERDLLVLHHHVDPAEMEQVLDLEGSRDTLDKSLAHAWRPRSAPRGFLIAELDANTLVYGFRKAVAVKDEVARLRSMGELSQAPIHAVLVHKAQAGADAGVPRTTTVHLDLTAGEKDTVDLKVTTDLEEIVPPEEVARTFQETLADYGLELGTRRGATIFDRLAPDKREHTWSFRGQVSRFDLPNLVQGRQR